MKKKEIIKVFIDKSIWTSVLIGIVIAAVIIITTVIHNISAGIENKIYNSSVSFYPHIKLTSNSPEIANMVYEHIKQDSDKVNVLLLKRIIASVDNDCDIKVNNNIVYVTSDANNPYFESLLPNICHEADSLNIPTSVKRDILKSMRIDTISVDAFRKAYLPGIIIGKDLEKKLKLDSKPDEYGRSTVKLTIGEKEQEFITIGTISSGNSFLNNICLIDDLYNLKEDFMPGMKYEILIQLKKLKDALQDTSYYNKHIYTKVKDKIDKKHITFWTDEKAFMNIIDLSKRISNAIGLVTVSNWILAMIALFALVSLIIQKRRKEISIMLSMGKTHRFIFSIIIGIIIIIFVLSAVFALAFIGIVTYFWTSFFTDIPYEFTWISVGFNILLSSIFSLMAAFASYYFLALKGRKLIINIYKGV